MVRDDPRQIYYVTHWPYHEHREMPVRRTWVKAKVDFQDDDWIRIAGHRHSCEALATWIVLRGLALLSPYRGLILTAGAKPVPHTLATITSKSRLKRAKMERGLRVLVEDVGWIGATTGSDYAKISHELWGAVFSIQGLTDGTSRERRGGPAGTARTSRASGAPTLDHRTTQDTTNVVERADAQHGCASASGAQGEGLDGAKRECAVESPSGMAELAGLPLYEEDERLRRGWTAFREACRKAYPGVDFGAELRRAYAWETANPTRRKKDRKRFLNNWLARAQDRGVTHAPSHAGGRGFRAADEQAGKFDGVGTVICVDGPAAGAPGGQAARPGEAKPAAGG